MKKKQLAILTMAALLAAVPASVPVLGAETEETKQKAQKQIFWKTVFTARHLTQTAECSM